MKVWSDEEMVSFRNDCERKLNKPLEITCTRHMFDTHKEIFAGYIVKIIEPDGSKTIEKVEESNIEPII